RVARLPWADLPSTCGAKLTRKYRERSSFSRTVMSLILLCPQSCLNSCSAQSPSCVTSPASEVLQSEFPLDVWNPDLSPACFHPAATNSSRKSSSLRLSDARSAGAMTIKSASEKQLQTWVVERAASMCTPPQAKCRNIPKAP